MAWDHLSITSPHLVYIILGGFTTLFMLCSSVIKERLYIGEATVATLVGIIFGPHAANLINPGSWGSSDIVTIEFSRIVLVVQCFAVGVELPKFYMEKHWRSVVFLLVPVMTWGWLLTSLVIWWLVPPLDWLESLVVAACVTATDPVLASSVVGKGKFAERVPKHLRDLLSAESGCNDGMAFPFVYLAIYLIQDHQSAGEVTYHWIVWTILYECVFGAFYGFVIGYIARHSIKYAEEHDFIDRESLLVFYFVLALFCAGSGSILGIDDLLVGFACGVGFSNDGWFTQKTEDAHVSNVIDLLLNLTYFVYFGTIIPWDQFNNADLGMSAWKLVVLSIFVLLFRRIPIMMALRPLIPDVKTWREGLFAGHFGPIGVGAVFVAMMARAEMEHEKPVPLAEVPTDPNTPHYMLLTLVWPIVSFLVMTSIIVHGSSIAVFTLGKHINTLTLTMSYTQAQEDGPSWMNRLPRISSQSKSQAASMSSQTDLDENKMPDVPPGTLQPNGYPGNFLRRAREGEKDQGHGSRASSHNSRRRRKKWDDGIGPGGHVSQSAIYPQRHSQSERSSTLRDSTPRLERDLEKGDSREQDDDRQEDGGNPELTKSKSPISPGIEIYEEGPDIVVENEDGDVINVDAPHHERPEGADMDKLKHEIKKEAKHNAFTYDALKSKFHDWREEETEKRKVQQGSSKGSAPARAYQFGNTVIVEDASGEVVKKYELPPHKAAGGQAERMTQGINSSLKMMGMGQRKKSEKGPSEPVTDAQTAEPARAELNRAPSRAWTGYKRNPEEADRKRAELEEAQEADDAQIRFTIGGAGKRMTKADFIAEVRKLDKGARREVVEKSDAPRDVKELAKQDPPRRPTIGTKTTSEATSRRKDSSAAAAQSFMSNDGRTQSHTPSNSAISPAGPSRQSSASSSDSSGPMRHPFQHGNDEAETPAERRRRLAAMKGIEGNSDAEDANEETPAERRRREAALRGAGPSEPVATGTEGSQSAPARRGIRFAETPERGRK